VLLAVKCDVEVSLYGAINQIWLQSE